MLQIQNNVVLFSEGVLIALYSLPSTHILESTNRKSGESRSHRRSAGRCLRRVVQSSN